MMNINKGTAHLVAGDAQATTASIDQALLQQARFCTTLIEAAADSELGISASQSVLEAVASGIARLVDSRASVATAIKQLTRIQHNSNLAEVSFGCPGGWYRTPAPALAAANSTLAPELAF